MSDFSTTLAPLVILINTDESNVLADLDDANTIIIYSPSTLTNTIRVQVSYNGTNFYDLKSSGSNVTIGVDAAVTITDIAFNYLKLKASGNEAAERTFIARKQYTVR